MSRCPLKGPSPLMQPPCLKCGGDHSSPFSNHHDETCPMLPAFPRDGKSKMTLPGVSDSPSWWYLPEAPQSREHLGPKVASRPKGASRPTRQATSLCGKIVHEASIRCLSRSRRCKSRTRRPKVVRGDRLASQRTLVDLILSVSTIIGLPLPSFQGDRRGRSSSEPFYAFDPEIERTLHHLKEVRHTVTTDSSSFGSIWNSENSNFTTDESNFSKHQEAGSMENNDRTLEELATPDVVYQPCCIQCSPLEPTQSYELKSILIHLLPKFYGLAGEDPHKHLKEFHVVCSTMRPQGILEDHIKMKAFPFSLDGAVKDWLYLQPVLFNTWEDMKCMFLKKLFLASRTATIRKEICDIRQHSGETLHEYWERFNKLCATCPHHQISEQLLIQYFYEGLMMMDRSMIDAASGGALMGCQTRFGLAKMLSMIFCESSVVRPLCMDERSKLDMKTRMYDTSEKKLVKSCDVQFMEDQTIEDIDKVKKTTHEKDNSLFEIDLVRMPIHDLDTSTNNEQHNYVGDQQLGNGFDIPLDDDAEEEQEMSQDENLGDAPKPPPIQLRSIANPRSNSLKDIVYSIMAKCENQRIMQKSLNVVKCRLTVGRLKCFQDDLGRRPTRTVDMIPA
ncbi:hypothetical protein CR513_56683, partial [Mucuna pruriens]